MLQIKWIYFTVLIFGAFFNEDFATYENSPSPRKINKSLTLKHCYIYIEGK